MHFCQTRLHDYRPALITAADVFCYLGRLDELIAACKPYKLAFSVELLKDGSADWKLAPTGRWQHNPDYIARLLKQNGYTIVNQYPLILRQECGQDVEGLIFTAA